MSFPCKQPACYLHIVTTLSNPTEKIHMEQNAPDSEFSIQLSCIFTFS